MKLSRRQLINVIAVGVVSVVALAWAAVSLAGVRFDTPQHLAVRLTATGGALPGSQVTYLGVPIGKVSSARLVPGAVELRLTLRPKGPMARVLRADVRQKSSLGEPYLDLSPATPGLPVTRRLIEKVIPVERSATPKPLSTLLSQADAVLAQVKPPALGAFADGLSGLVGHDQDLRTLVQSWAEVGRVVGRRHGDMGELLRAASELTAALDANRSSLSSSITGAAGVGTVLAARTEELGRILERGADFATDASALLAALDADLKGGVLPGIDVTVHNMAIRPTKMRETWHWMPEFMEKVGYTLDGTTMNIGVGNSMPLAPWYQPRFAIPIYGEGLRLDKIFLPTIAQRIEIEMGPQPPAAMLRLLSPEEASYAMRGPAETAEVQKRKQDELAARTTPTENP